MHFPPGCKSRPLNHASSCAWYLENSLKTKLVSGNCLQPLMPYSECSLLQIFLATESQLQTPTLGARAFGSSAIQNYSDHPDFQVRFDTSPSPKPRCSSVPSIIFSLRMRPDPPFPPTTSSPLAGPPSWLTSSLSLFILLLVVGKEYLNSPCSRSKLINVCQIIES